NTYNKDTYDYARAPILQHYFISTLPLNAMYIKVKLLETWLFSLHIFNDKAEERRFIMEGIAILLRGELKSDACFTSREHTGSWRHTIPLVDGLMYLVVVTSFSCF
ncbi:hypothetical protein ACJX0J_007855, partial [Zea mays]